PCRSREGGDGGGEAEGGPERPVDPLEKVARARGQAGERLLRLKLEPESSRDSDGENGEDANESGARDDRTDLMDCDIEQNVRKIEAILRTNAEIFDRCMHCMTTGREPGGASTSFTSYSFDTVQAYPLRSSTQFITFPQRSEKFFDTKPLSKLPSGIDDLIVSKGKEGRFFTFIDYEAFFETSLLLHEEVLVPFLAKLKGHLITVQVCLGEIDSWIREAQSIIDFLEETFAVEIERPTSDTMALEDTCRCPTGSHSDILRCLHCNRTFGDHYGGNRCSSPSDRYNYDYRDTTFKCRMFQVLKLCDNPSVKIEATFDIASEIQRRKLSKLLEFMAVE
ncbi:hypothetical protein ACHAWF_004127, partial [Thalassiosira exigua]